MSPQDADPTTLDEVQVQGIRESIQTSINKKRDDTVISDVLSAEDIGDLPAPSLADAIEFAYRQNLGFRRAIQSLLVLLLTELTGE